MNQLIRSGQSRNPRMVTVRKHSQAVPNRSSWTSTTTKKPLRAAHRNRNPVSTSEA